MTKKFAQPVTGANDYQQDANLANSYTRRMRTRLRLKPGQPGTKQLTQQFGDRLVCVRYLYDERRKRRYKTVELIVEEKDWQPKLKPSTVVYLRINWGELEISSKIKFAGGKWNRRKQHWELRYDLVLKLGLEDRIIGHESIYG